MTQSKIAILNAVNKGLSQIGAPTMDMETLFVRGNDDHSILEASSESYAWVTFDRGRETSRTESTDLDDVLFCLFDGVTLTQAMTPALSAAKPGLDWRRWLFREQARLLEKLNPRWVERASEKQLKILEQNPFQDDDPTLIAAHGF